MASILLLDDHEVAGRAMRGILARGNHRCLVATRIEEAWQHLRAAVLIDLVIVEIKLKAENGFDFIQELRADCFFKPIPVLVYTALEDHSLAKRAFALKVQSYLLKPYSDILVREEVAKACANPWRDRLFEEERSFCAQMGLKPDALRKMLQDLQAAIEQSLAFFASCAEGQPGPAALARIAKLSDQAQTAGFWGVFEYLDSLRNSAEAEEWAAFKHAQVNLSYAARLIHCRLNPTYLPEILVSDQEKEEREQSKAKAMWLVDINQTGPVLAPDQVMQQLDGLPGFPVIDSVGAAFQMAADGRTQNLTHVMGLAYRDPALTMQVLLAADRLEREDNTPVDDPRVAVNLLGYLRLHRLGQALPLVAERTLNLPPLSWASFWTFQIGVARLAEFTCRFLEFANQAAHAYVAGLLHDVGKLLLLRLYPFGFQAIVTHALRERISLSEAERRYIGCTSREMAWHFACKHHLPAPYCNVIRWVEAPASASDDTDLVAVVSLARHLCLQNQVGCCGDSSADTCPPLAETAAWRVLQRRVFTGFNLAQFEEQARAFCRDIS